MLLLLACAHTPAPAPVPRDDVLLVSAYKSGVVAVVDPETGTVLERIEGIAGAQAIRTGPDGHLYVAAEERGEVLRIVDGKAESWVSEGLEKPTGLAFGPDGTLYVGDFSRNAILSFSRKGKALGTVATGLDGVDAGLVWGSDDTLWVPCFDGNRVVKVDPVAGSVTTWLDVRAPRSLVDNDGQLWLTSWRGSAVQRLDEGTLTTVAEVGGPSGLWLDEDTVWVVSDQRPVLFALDRDGTLRHCFELPDLEGLTFITRGR